MLGVGKMTGAGRLPYGLALSAVAGLIALAAACGQAKKPGQALDDSSAGGSMPDDPTWHGADHAAAPTPGLKAAYLAAVQQSASAQYDFARASGDEIAASNRALGCSLASTERGLQISSEGEHGWAVELALTAVGRGDQLEDVEPEKTASRIDRNRLSQSLRGGLEQWFLNGPLGVEQGFVVPTRPVVAGRDERSSSSDAGLTMVVDVQGTLRPAAARSTKSVELRDDAGRVALVYRDLYAHDARGRWLRARMRVRGRSILLDIDDRQAVYPVTVDPMISTASARLTSGSPARNAEFGCSVAISGDLAAVGACREATDGQNRGVAYIFERDEADSDNWSLLQRLAPNNPVGEVYFGGSVAISGETIVVGAYQQDSNSGAVYFFDRGQGGGNAWGQVAIRTADIESWFGHSVSVSGNIAIVGAPYEEGAGGGSDHGAVYVYARGQGGQGGQGQLWEEVKRITAADPEDGAHFGAAVAVDGEFAVVGADMHDADGSPNCGAAYVLAGDLDDPDQWEQVHGLHAGDPDADAHFGRTVAISEDTVVVGAEDKDESGVSNAGAAYVFSRNWTGQNAWGQVTKLTSDDSEEGDHFGSSVAIGMDTIVVGAPEEDVSGKTHAGRAYVFYESDQYQWEQVARLTSGDSELSGHFGSSVFVDGNTAIVGAPSEDSVAHDNNCGVAYVFNKDPDDDSWGQSAEVVGAAQANSYFGQAIALDTVVVQSRDNAVLRAVAVVGAPHENGSYENSGAVYIFYRDGDESGGWSFIKRLAAKNIGGSTTNAHFGQAVAIDGDLIVVGARDHQPDGVAVGAAYIY